jgi:hypothetical protein
MKTQNKMIKAKRTKNNSPDNLQMADGIAGIAASKTISQSDAQQIKMLEGDDSKIREGLARDTGLSPSLQTKLLQDTEEAVLIVLASNPSLLEEGQEKLASTGTPAVRKELAANPKLNERFQNYLATTGSDEVKCHLAMNPSLIAAIQSLLADDEKYVVRAALAANPALDKTLLDKLMCDNDTNVKCGLASNPALPIDLQNRLANSECDNRRQLEWVLASLAKNPSLADELMEKFAVSDIGKVRESLACNSSLPEYLQARLIANNYGKVLENLACNASLKVAQQAELAHVGNVDVRLALLDNPSLYQPIKRRVMASFDKYDLSSAEHDLDYAEKKASRLNTEYSDAGKKYERTLGMSMSFLSAFTSDEKLEQLYRKVQRAQEEESEAWDESVDLSVKCRKLRALLEQRPKVQPEINGIFNGGLVFS